MSHGTLLMPETYERADVWAKAHFSRNKMMAAFKGTKKSEMVNSSTERSKKK